MLPLLHLLWSIMFVQVNLLFWERGCWLHDIRCLIWDIRPWSCHYRVTFFAVRPPRGGSGRKCWYGCFDALFKRHGFDLGASVKMPMPTCYRPLKYVNLSMYIGLMKREGKCNIAYILDLGFSFSSLLKVLLQVPERSGHVRYILHVSTNRLCRQVICPNEMTRLQRDRHDVLV